CLLPQLVCKLFSPLSRTDESILFRVPTAKNNRASRLPALLQQRRETVTHFQHRRRAAVWIYCAEHPCVAMVAEYYPTILLLVAIDARDDIPDLPLLVVHVSLQTQLHIVRSADVISEWQAALKSTRRPHRSFELREDRLRDVVSNQLHRQTCQVSRFFGFQTRRSRNRRFAWREWIAGIV